MYFPFKIEELDKLDISLVILILSFEIKGNESYRGFREKIGRKG